MQIFDEKIEKLLILDDQSKLDSLSQEVREAVILLYLRELFEKDKEVMRAYYPPLQLFFQRDQNGHPKQVLAFELLDEQPSLQSESNESKTDSLAEKTKENVNEQDEHIDEEMMATEDMNQVIQKALNEKTPAEYKTLQCFARKQPAKEIGKNAYLYPHEDGFVLVQDPEHAQMFKSLEAAWLSFGLNDVHGKYSSILNDEELSDILGDYLCNPELYDYRKVFEDFSKQVDKLRKGA